MNYYLRFQMDSKTCFLITENFLNKAKFSETNTQSRQKAALHACSVDCIGIIPYLHLLSIC